METSKTSLSDSGAPDRPIWIDGEFRPWADATVHVLSHSMQRGSLVLDYLGLHSPPHSGAVAGEGRRVFVFRLQEHVERFRRSCEMMGLHLEQSQAELEAAICETVRANPGSRVVKISAYVASVEVDIVPMNPHVTVAIAAYDPMADIMQRLPAQAPRPPQAVKLWLEKERANRHILSPQAKVAASYVSPMIAKVRAREEGYSDVLLIDQEGHLTEAPTTNLFLVDAAGELLTPTADRVLQGVTRRSIIELAKAEGIPFREATIEPEALWSASEAFLTGTSGGVFAVESVDGRSIGEVYPGPVATRLRDRLNRARIGEDPDFEHWITRIDE